LTWRNCTIYLRVRKSLIICQGMKCISSLVWWLNLWNSLQVFLFSLIGSNFFYWVRKTIMHIQIIIRSNNWLHNLEILAFSIRRLLLKALSILFFFRRSNLLKVDKSSHSCNIHNVRRGLDHTAWSTSLRVNLVIIICLRSCPVVSPLMSSSV